MGVGGFGRTPPILLGKHLRNLRVVRSYVVSPPPTKGSPRAEENASGPGRVGPVQRQEVLTELRDLIGQRPLPVGDPPLPSIDHKA